MHFNKQKFSIKSFYNKVCYLDIRSEYKSLYSWYFHNIYLRTAGTSQMPNHSTYFRHNFVGLKIETSRCEF